MTCTYRTRRRSHGVFFFHVPVQGNQTYQTVWPFIREHGRVRVYRFSAELITARFWSVIGICSADVVFRCDYTRPMKKKQKKKRTTPRKNGSHVPAGHRTWRLLSPTPTGSGPRAPPAVFRALRRSARHKPWRSPFVLHADGSEYNCIDRPGS